jgi:membrane protein CcdC involved in cytochrome C biogenesis
MRSEAINEHIKKITAPYRIFLKNLVIQPFKKLFIANELQFFAVDIKSHLMVYCKTIPLRISKA